MPTVRVKPGAVLEVVRLDIQQNYYPSHRRCPPGRRAGAWVRCSALVRQPERGAEYSPGRARPHGRILRRVRRPVRRPGGHVCLVADGGGKEGAGRDRAEAKGAGSGPSAAS